MTVHHVSRRRTRAKAKHPVEPSPLSTTTTMTTTKSVSTQKAAPRGVKDEWDRTRSKAAPPRRDPISGASVLEVRAAKAASPLDQLLKELVPPRADQCVLELGVGASVPAGYAAAHALAGAQVTAFVDGAEAEQAHAALDAYHHVEQRGEQALSSLGIENRFDLVIASSRDVRGDHDLESMVGATAPGGKLVFLTATTRPPKKLLACAQQHGLELMRHVRVDGEVAWVLSRPGARRTDAGLDRITCVDRERVADLLASPVVTGPATLLGVNDDDATLRAQLDALVAFVQQGVDAGRIDVSALPFPDRVAKSALDGEPGLDALAVFAHPDDESGYAAGLLAAHARAHKSMHLVVATDGAGGVGYQLENGTSLAAVRAKELEGALTVLGVGGHTVLGLPDAGMYRDDHRAAPVTAADTLALWGLMQTVEVLVREIRTHRPRALLGFDLERDPGYSLHGHHMAMGIVAALALHLAADPRAFPEQKLAPWSIEQHWAVIPPGTRGGTQQTVDVDCDKKLDALKAHRSQFLSVARLLEQPVETEHWHRVQGRVRDVSLV